MNSRRVSAELDYLRRRLALCSCTDDGLYRLVVRDVPAAGRLATLAPEAALWLCWPKMTSPLFNGLKGSAIREAGLAAGLVDIKVCAVSEVWSGLKLVWRKEKRGKDPGPRA